jgi:G3E family GTPase
VIPVFVLTGFLGAGKTTLLRRLLRDPAHADSAIIINEFGEIPLDHDLLAASEESFVSTATGCLCCVVRSDLAATLLDLHRRRALGEVPAYRRVIIETSGLADPAPVLHALMTEAPVAETHTLRAVTTLVDALHGATALQRHPEAERQARLADRIVITKPDLAETAALRAQLRALNSAAPIREAAQGDISADWLLAPAERTADWIETTARHSNGLSSLVIEREAPIPAMALTLWLQGLAEHLGSRLLRLKGLVAIAEAPETPAVLHGIGHVMHAPEWLDAWPSADHRSRLVLIGQGIPRHWPLRLLTAIEEEVHSVTGWGGAGAG